ncbi:hypothetical protein ACWDA9_14635, partial [Streptomyces sp. NPDC001193]
MNRELLLHDWLVAGIAVAAGAVAGLVLRALMRWLGRHAERTRWNGDDLIVDALRTLVPWAAVIAGAAGAFLGEHLGWRSAFWSVGAASAVA